MQATVLDSSWTVYSNIELSFWLVVVDQLLLCNCCSAITLLQLLQCKYCIEIAHVCLLHELPRVALICIDFVVVIWSEHCDPIVWVE